MQRQMFTAILLGLLLGAQLAHGQDSDKLDIKKLEDKYWSAKDDDFSVVQNRTYQKANRFFVSLYSGFPLNDPYSNGNINGFSAGYFTSERWGYEVTYLSDNFRDNDATDQFIVDHKTVPNHNTLNKQMTASVNFVPLYAKMSFLDKKIIYFDMGIGLGLGQTEYTQNISTGNQTMNSLHYLFDVYQQFFFSERFSLKLSFRNTWTTEERMRYKLNPGESESNRSLGSKAINDSALLFGLTTWF